MAVPMLMKLVKSRCCFTRNWIHSLYAAPYRTFYSKEMGIPRSVLAFIQQDIDFSPKTVKHWLERQKWKQLKEQHVHQKENIVLMGENIAAAQFVLKHGGAVKFVERDKWYRKNKDGFVHLPNKYTDGFTVEAIDASNTTLMYSSFDNFANLQSLMYLNLSQCPHIDDWCLARLHMFSESLKFLDVSGCPRVTERGLATLHHLNLRGLKITDMPSVDNKELVTILLEEMLPDCSVVGVDYTNPHADVDKRTVISRESDDENVMLKRSQYEEEKPS